MRRWILDARGRPGGDRGLCCSPPELRRRPTRRTVCSDRTARPRPCSATPTRSASGSSSPFPESTPTATGFPTRCRSTSSGRPRRTQGMKVPAIIDPSPYYTSVGRGNESAVHPHDRGRPPRQVPALLRQLLRPARLRGDPRRRGRHRLLDRLPAARRPGRRRGSRRSSTGSTGRIPGYTTRRQTRCSRLAQRQEGDDRQVVRRHVRQRRRRDRRRRADHHRPDLGDLRLVRLLADGRDPVHQHYPAFSRHSITQKTQRPELLGVAAARAQRVLRRRARHEAAGRRGRRPATSTTSGTTATTS